ncbi:MAG: hypothetical protein IJ685_14385 [Selenomonadaceae bacterium]|nr:hypothetical protein [Selenomonadaceae bacterium]
MKKFCGILILTITLLFAGSYNNCVEAADYYLGVYHSGQEAYLDTSSIRTTNEYTQGWHSGDTYTCTVRAVWSGSNSYSTVNYEVYVGQTVTLYKNGEEVFRTIRAKDPKYLDKNPVEYNLVRYFEKLSQQEWSSVPERIR